MNVLYLTYDGLTDSLGQSQVLPYVIGLSKKGYKYTIISFEKSQAFAKQEAIIRQLTTANRIKWKPQKYTKNPPFISTLLDIQAMKKAVKEEVKNGNIGLIHCRSYISALVGLWAWKKYNIPYVFDMRGFWADERIDGKIWRLDNSIHKKAYDYFKRKEKEFLTHAAHTISLTHNGKEEMETWKLNPISPITVIPCCTDEELFKKTPNSLDRRKELSIRDDQFVLLYLGSIGTWYMLEEMLDFFKVVLSKKPDSVFLFISRDDESKILEEAAKRSISKEQIIVKPANRIDVPSYIAASDAAIFFIKPLYSKKASSPTKMGEIMNMGVPIVCNSGVGDVDVMMNAAMPQLLVEKFTEESYSAVLDALLAGEKSFQTEEIIQNSLDYFSLSNGIEKYHKVYQEVLK